MKHVDNTSHVTNLSYLRERDEQLTNKNCLFFFISQIIFCSKHFIDWSQYIYCSFPLVIRGSCLIGVFIHKDLLDSQTVKFENKSTWSQALLNGIVLTIQYRFVKTDADFNILMMCERNQLNNEILVAVVHNIDHLQQIKMLTLTKKWKRIPCFVPYNDIINIVQQFESKLGTPGKCIDVVQDNGWIRLRLAPGGCRFVREQYEDLVYDEYTLFLSIHRTGEAEKLYQRFIQNIDNPLSFLNFPNRKI